MTLLLGTLGSSFSLKQPLNLLIIIGTLGIILVTLSRLFISSNKQEPL